MVPFCTLTRNWLFRTKSSQDCHGACSAPQFVHEPLAALYGYLRGSTDADSAVRGLMRRNVLVVDWGGGTLDLTLCRIEPGRILQRRNGGTQQVGGDKFDQVIRDEVVTR